MFGWSLPLLVFMAASDPGSSVGPILVVGDPMEPYRGKPVLDVEIEAPRSEDGEELRDLIAIERGYLLSTTDVQNALKRLHALGRFANVQAFAERRAGTVLLRFVLRPLLRLRSIDVEGANSVDEDALIEGLGITIGGEVDRRTDALLQDKALSFLQRAGFVRASVSVARATHYEDTEGVDFTVSVVEGEPLRIASVEFVGPRRGPELALRGIVVSRPGEPLDQDVLAADRAALAAAYIDRGFLRAVVDDPVCVLEGAGDGTPPQPCAQIALRARDNAVQVRVQFHLDAGDRIHLELRGNRLLSDSTLRALWPEEDGQLRRGTLPVLRERIRERYRRLGFADCSVTLRGFRDREARITRYVMHVHEGEAIELQNIEFVGATAIDADVLIDQVRTKLARELESESLTEPLDPSDRDGLLWLGLAALATPPRLLPADRRWVETIVEQALDDVRVAYRDRGYLDALVEPEEPAFSSDRRTATLRVRVVEGERTDVASIRFADNTAFSASDLLDEVGQVESEEKDRGALSVELGGPFSASALGRARIRLLRRYRDQGYWYARVFADLELSQDRHQAMVTFRFEEGPQVRIERVLVRGNRVTQDWVIRTRISLQENDIYRLDHALADQSAIAALGIFKNVKVKLIDEERPSELKDLVAEVEERDRQSVEFVPGISTADGVRGRLSYSFANLLGTAAMLSASAKINYQLFFGLYGKYSGVMRRRYDVDGGEILSKGLERDINIDLRVPSLMFLPWDPSFRLGAFLLRDNSIPASYETFGGVLGIELSPAKALHLAIEPQLARTNLECPLEDPDLSCSDAASAGTRGLQTISEGQTDAFKVGPRLTLDLRNSPLNPTRGFFSTLAATYATGEFRPQPKVHLPFSYIKGDVGLTGFIALWRIVLVLQAKAGTIWGLGNGGIPVPDRFFVGGRETLRGFVEQTLIPQDACVIGRDDPVGISGPRCKEEIRAGLDGEGNLVPVSKGGNHYLATRAELRLPITEIFSLNLFADAANLWVAWPTKNTMTLRLGTGAGLRINTPVGSVVLDFGFNPALTARQARRRLERAEELGPQPHFAVGAQ